MTHRVSAPICLAGLIMTAPALANPAPDTNICQPSHYGTKNCADGGWTAAMLHPRSCLPDRQGSHVNTVATPNSGANQTAADFMLDRLIQRLRSRLAGLGETMSEGGPDSTTPRRHGFGAPQPQTKTDASGGSEVVTDKDHIAADKE